MRDMNQIGVIGSGTLIDKSIYKVAYDVGKEIALNDFILICGGKGGVMEAASKGAKEANGIIVGILPSIDKNEANNYITVRIPTNLGENRNYIVVQSSDIVVCIAGEVGTRMEAEYTLKLEKPLITIPKTGGTSLAITKESPASVFVVENAKQVINKVLELIENLK